MWGINMLPNAKIEHQVMLISLPPHSALAGSHFQNFLIFPFNVSSCKSKYMFISLYLLISYTVSTLLQKFF